MSLLVNRIEGLERDLDEVAKQANEIPVLKSQVEMLAKAVDRLTSAIYQGAVAFLVTGVLGVLTALILKGVIG